MFEKVLFPTDFSECNLKILDYLSELKKVGVKEIILIRVINLNRVTGIAGGIDIEEYIESEEKEAEKKLSELVEFLKAEGLNARYVKPIPAGDPVTEILKAAEEEEVSLIIIGSRGKSVVKEILLGSVSEGVVRKANVPVIVVKFELVEKGDSYECRRIFPKMFERILYAHDLTEHSDKVLKFVKYAAKKANGSVTILHVIENDKTDKLEKIKEELNTEGIETKVIVKKGVPHKMILKVAEEEKSTIIFMGSRGMGLIQSLLLGSVVDAVVRHSKIPVFVYKG
ncbi:MAG: universal stress protein [Archaeoglobaceae archaeon]|nr:universal stress protein [Archaeoglobaceae archaeon]